jgi:hypothetical protein
LPCDWPVVLLIATQPFSSSPNPTPEPPALRTQKRYVRESPSLATRIGRWARSSWTESPVELSTKSSAASVIDASSRR